MRERTWFAGIVAVVAVTILAGCGGTGVPPGATPAETLAHAERKIADEDFLDAVEILEGLLRANPGSALVPELRMRLGDAHFGLEEYVLSGAEYERVIQEHPSSPFVEEARFKIARSAYASIHAFDRDPTETDQSIALLDAFLRDYPESAYALEAKVALADCRERLARREFETGRFYERRNRKRSALIQYEFVATQYPETTWANQALFRLGEVHRSRLELEEAAASYHRLLEVAPDTEEAKLAKSALAELSAEFPLPPPPEQVTP